MSNEQVKTVVKKQTTEVATINMEQFADVGFENVSAKD